MTERRHLMAKVTLVGDKAVGKTSLVRRYVLDQFDDSYLLTLGTKVTKKVIDVPVREKDALVTLDMNIWDIMGQVGFRELGKEAYFHGARGIFAVVDLTRRETLNGIGEWIRAVQDVAGSVPKILAANKKDLLGQAASRPEDIQAAARSLGCPSFLTSARTGENVEAAFQALATLVVRAYYGL